MNPTATTLTATPPKFPAHVAARIAKTYGPRPVLTAVAAGDSDPNADELLRRARKARQRRLETETAYLEREQQFGRQVAAEIATGVAA